MSENRIGSARPAGIHQVDERLIARTKLVCYRLAGLREARNDPFAMREDGGGSPSAAGIQKIDELFVTRPKVVRRRLARLRQSRDNPFAMSKDRFGGACAGLVDAVDEVLAAGAEIGSERLSADLQAFVDLGDAVEQRIGALVARFDKALGYIRTESVQRLAHLRALLGDAPDRLGAGAVKRCRNVFRRRVERRHDVAAGIGEALVKPVRNGV